jgi:hypothetical protein
MTRQITALWIGFLILWAVVDRPVSAQSAVVATIETHAAAHGVSGAYLVRVAYCESELNPSAVGDAGEIGLFQLHPAGNLPHFRAVGFRNPWSADEQASYAAQAFAGVWLRDGIGPKNWSCR